MHPDRREDFTEIQKNQERQRGTNGRCNADMGHLAEAAGWIILSIRVGVWGDLQQEKQGDERQCDCHGCGQPPVWPE